MEDSNKTDFENRVFDYVDYIYVARDRDEQRSLFNTIMNLSGS
jgi:hypothetical protein